MNVDITTASLGKGPGRDRTSTSRTSGRRRPRSPRLVERTVYARGRSSRNTGRRVQRATRSGKGVEVPKQETYDLARRPRPTSRTRPISAAVGANPGTISNIEGAKVLAILGDMITTDHTQPGRLVQGYDAGRQVPDPNGRCPSGEFKLLRVAAPWQPRGGEISGIVRGESGYFRQNIRIRKRDALDGRRGRLKLLGRNGQPDLDLRNAAMGAHQEGGPRLVDLSAASIRRWGPPRDWGAAKGHGGSGG